MSTLEYWLWLTDRAKGSAIQVSRLLERFGTPEQVYCADAAAYESLQALSPQVRAGLEDKSLEQPMEILERCARLDIGLLTAQDAGYPDCLRGIHDPPLVLYYKGRLPDVDRLLTVGVVGSRQCTQYGATMAARLGLELARAGAVVVSGTAKGIDTSALRGALSAGGTVISVLGGGIDVPYPIGNGPLYQDVAAAGALISEYPPGTSNKAAHFPVRNRILSGLCDGVAAVEAGEKSGASITVGLALEQNRDAFAFPGPADAPMSAGTNRMIRMGWARLVTGAADILEEYRGRRPITRPPPLEEREEEMLAHTLIVPAESPPEEKKKVDKQEDKEYIDWKQARQTFTDDEMDVLRLLNRGEQTAQQLVEMTQLPTRRVLSAITVLQMRGYVNQDSGGRLSSKVAIRGGAEE